MTESTILPISISSNYLVILCTIILLTSVTYDKTGLSNVLGDAWFQSVNLYLYPWHCVNQRISSTPYLDNNLSVS